MNIDRIAYAVWLLEQISQRQPDNGKIMVMYDIAYTLVRHLKVYDMIKSIVVISLSLMRRKMTLRANYI